MGETYEVQHLSSLDNVNRKRRRRDGTLSALNLLILLLGFACVAVGYVISNMPRERLATMLGSGSVSIERQAPAISLERSARKISKSLLDLVR